MTQENSLEVFFVSLKSSFSVQRHRSIIYQYTIVNQCEFEIKNNIE